MKDTLKTFTLPAGTVCKRGGIAFALAQDTEIRCYPDNWPLIRDGFKPSVSYEPDTCERNQSLHCADIPCVAQPDEASAITNSSSLPSKAGLQTSRT